MTGVKIWPAGKMAAGMHDDEDDSLGNSILVPSHSKTSGKILRSSGLSRPRLSHPLDRSLDPRLECYLFLACSVLFFSLNKRIAYSEYYFLFYFLCPVSRPNELWPANNKPPNNPSTPPTAAFGPRIPLTVLFLLL